MLAALEPAYVFSGHLHAPCRSPASRPPPRAAVQAATPRRAGAALSAAASIQAAAGLVP